MKRAFLILIVSCTLLVGCVTLVPMPIGKEPTSLSRAMQEVLDNGNNVTIAIIIDSITNLPLRESRNDLVYEDWQHGTKNNLITSAEQDLLSHFQHYNNFKIADRNVTDKIIKEHNFQLSGLTENIIGVGKLLGATHLYIISFARNPTPKRDAFVDTVNYRLVDIKDGHVIGVYQSRSTIK